jgi:hypothetical protein
MLYKFLQITIVLVSKLTCSSNGMPKVFLIMISTLSAKSGVSFSIKPDRKVAEITT